MENFMKPSRHKTNFLDGTFEFYNDIDYKTVLENTEYFQFKPLVYVDYNEETNVYEDYKELKDNEIVIKNPLYKFIEDKKNIYDLDRRDVQINFETNYIELYFGSIGRRKDYFYALPKEKFYLYNQISWEGLFFNDTLILVRDFTKIFKPTPEDIRDKDIIRFDNSFIKIIFNDCE